MSRKVTLRAGIGEVPNSQFGQRGSNTLTLTKLAPLRDRGRHVNKNWDADMFTYTLQK